MSTHILSKPTNIYFPALTGIRACAAYVVFLTHFNPFQKFGWAWHLAHEGNSGVTIFFVLSGFLITVRYSERITLSREWLGTYIRNRIARIYPMYFLLTCLTFLLIWHNPSYDPVGQWNSYVGHDTAIMLLLNFSLLRGFFLKFIFTGIAPGWTLTIEETFYLMAPLLLLGVVKARQYQTTLLLYAVALVAFGSCLVWLVPHKFGFMASYNYMFTYTFFGRCWEFLCGMGLAFFIRSRPTSAHSGIPRFTAAGLVWMAACIIAASLVNPTTLSDHAYDTAGLVLNNFVLPGGIVLFFLGLLWEESLVRKALETPLLQLLGKSSYVFYLIHAGILGTLLDRHMTRDAGVHFAVMVGLSILLFKLVEEPLHKLLRAAKPQPRLHPV